MKHMTPKLQDLISTRDALKLVLENIHKEGDELAQNPHRTMLAVVDLSVRKAKTMQALENTQYKINQALVTRDDRTHYL